MDKQKKTFNIIIILLIVILSGFIIFSILSKWHRSEITITKEQEKTKYDKTITKLEDNIDNLQTEIELQKEDIIPSEKIEEVFDKTSSETIDCDKMKSNVIGFFSYLDQKGYNSSDSKESGTYKLYFDSLQRLSKKQPVLTNNSTEFLTLLRSMSHFYRVLGDKNLMLIKQVVTEETEMLEPALASFYDWFTHAKKCNTNTKEIPSIETLYNYSYFFLNTLAGKSYMLRRSSKIRILTSYYSILIIDKANDETLNLYGYDIRHNIALLQDDIKNHRKLLYKKKYLNVLDIISKKYPQTDN